jgi:cellulose synthase/poly-beta-1,6-N-acetylglucosamine synthase-like glycosyltransferase
MSSGIFLALNAISFIVIIFMLGTASSYILLFLFSIKKVLREGKLEKNPILDDLSIQDRTYPVSILVPAYNEEVGVIASVRSLLTLDYPEYEIIVIDDGSKDRTLEVLIEEFKMKKVDYATRVLVPMEPVKGVYTSTAFPSIRVIEKLNGGKADALNCGINLSKYPYFCAIDGDSILEQDALIQTMKPIIDSDEEVIVVGGSVRIANGTTIVNSSVERIDLPSNPVIIMQVIEYFRAFLIGRLGFSRFNQLLIVSGAFGLFNKSAVIHAGGYRKDTVGEDMELIVRLHRINAEQKLNKRIEYIPDPVCWTEAPDSLTVLRRQRVRWQRGLAETLFSHRKMLFNPSYGLIGTVTFPFFLFVELFGSIFELAGFLIIILGLFFDFLSPAIVLTVFAVSLLYGSFISALAVLLEELTLHKFPKVKHLVLLFIWALTESLWYRPLLVLWRIEGLFSAFSKKSTWGDMERKGISTTES